MKDIKDNYICIQGWMISELNLKGNDLLVYAIIYGFSQDDESEFTGSLNYLAAWCNGTKSGIQKNIKNLIDRGLIIKKEHYKNDVKYCSYSCIVYNKVVRGIQQSCTQGIQQSCTNNINIKNNKNNRYRILEILPTKLLEYDLSDEIYSLLEDFYKILIDNKKIVSVQKIEADLSNIAKVSKSLQLQTIKTAIDRGWQSLNPDWLKSNNKSTRIEHSCNVMSQEEHLQNIETMKQESNYKF